ncbi:MAG: hypothetical protein ACOCQG_02945 [Candidatus Nanoarchaeia archaeon]
MKSWQKGIFYGFVFVVALSIVFTIVLIVIDLILNREDLPHMCFVFGQVTECTFSEALASRFKFMFVIVALFGPLVALFGGLIGYMVQYMKID